METIRIILNFTQDSKKYFSKQLKNGTHWDNFTLTNDERADYYVIINEPMNYNTYYDEKKTIYIAMEPTFSDWGKKFRPLIADNKHIYFHKVNGLEWWVGRNYDELINLKIDKSKNLSAIISDNYQSEYHIKRVNFLPYLDKLDNVDFFGFLNFPNSTGYNIIKSLKNYRGKLGNKELGLFPYKYTFASENAREEGYFTEKIADAIISECLCFYCGCPNITDFIDERAYIILDLNKPEEAKKIVEDAINSNEWEKRIDIIRKEKNKILNDLQLIPTIVNIIKKNFKND